MDAPSFAPPPLLLEAASPPETPGNPEEMTRIFNNCRTNNWDDVLAAVIAKPSLAMTPIIMDNHISTTILHQAITSKGNTTVRANVIRQILTTTPMAASLRNGYGSLPLHVITQRNTKIKSKVKEGLIRGFVGAYRQALLEEGGTGQRTPLHIIFTGTSIRNEILRECVCSRTYEAFIFMWISLSTFLSFPRLDNDRLCLSRTHQTDD